MTYFKCSCLSGYSGAWKISICNSCFLSVVSCPCTLGSALVLLFPGMSLTTSEECCPVWELCGCPVLQSSLAGARGCYEANVKPDGLHTAVCANCLCMVVWVASLFRNVKLESLVRWSDIKILLNDVWAPQCSPAVFWMHSICSLSSKCLQKWR